MGVFGMSSASSSHSSNSTGQNHLLFSCPHGILPYGNASLLCRYWVSPKDDFAEGLIYKYVSSFHRLYVLSDRILVHNQLIGTSVISQNSGNISARNGCANRSETRTKAGASSVCMLFSTEIIPYEENRPDHTFHHGDSVSSADMKMTWGTQGGQNN